MIGENIINIFPNSLKIKKNYSDYKILDPEDAEFDP
jgi:hypothetical protein